MGISPARVAAFDALIEIASKRAFSSIVLPQVEEGLSPADRGLCHELVLGVLRRQMWLDRLIDSSTGGRKLDRDVRITLRLGIFQLYFLDRVPDHAAVNDSVSLASRAKKSSAKGLVNAVLRKATRGTPQLDFADEIERISIEGSHPRWLIEKWASEFGQENAARLAA
ncbi:MAG TPA: transcription antitermination factor NusB, partial [Pyrinomonadaceae bacterium]